MIYVDLILPVPVHQTYTYHSPQTIPLFPGHRVLVSLRKRKLVGIVSNIHQDKPHFQTKPIEALLDEQPLLSALFLEWLQWASRYYVTPIGDVLSSALPSPLFKNMDQTALTKKKSRSTPTHNHWTDQKEIELNLDQNQILQNLFSQLTNPIFKPTLIHGITGSGKTEIYIRFIEQIVKQGQQAIFLVPEIGLTPQTIARFQKYFGTRLGVYHSGLTENQRLQEWMRAQKGEIDVMIGTRSALFTPFNKLGALVIDEEQDASYKQEEKFRYHARDLAIVRAKIEKCAIVLGTATPSMETFYNVHQNKYQLYSLHQRAAGALKPQIQIVDFAAEKRQTHSPLSLSQSLLKAIQENLKKNEQTLILLNRRGFARSFFCLSCQNVYLCPNCSVNLISHKKTKYLQCHYCDFKIPQPRCCPSCQSHEITLLGQGTETIEEELVTFFPQARIARLDRDTTQKKGTLIQTLKNLKDHKIDILVGTQMIAKGHDIPNVTLVGVIGADMGLSLPDFRSCENTFQLLTQVAGRAGRGERPGTVIIQSYSPKHYSIQCATLHDFELFYQTEIQNRKELGYPPVGRLIRFVFSSINQKKLQGFIKNLETSLQNKMNTNDFKKIQILGPAPTPLEKIRGRFRWHLILKGAQVSTLQKATHEIIKILSPMKSSDIKWTIDVDPLSML